MINVTTLEQSKLLKEWGAHQHTDYYYHRVMYSREDFDNYEIKLGEKSSPDDAWKGMHKDVIAAYSLEELIEWLLKDFEGNFLLDTQDNHSEWYAILRPYSGHTIHSDGGKTPLEAVFNLAQAVKGKQK